MRGSTRAMVVASFAVFIAAGLPGETAAQDDAARSRKIFKRLDKDNDGRIAPNEIRKGRDVFDRIDTNGDGSLDPDEFANRFKAAGGAGKSRGEQSGGKGRATPPVKTADRPASGRTTPGLYFIDAHSQMDHNVDEERVVSLMDHGGVHRTILSSHMRRDWSDISEFAERYPGRIVPAVRIKGRGYHKGPEDAYYDRLIGQVGHGGFKAMAEAHVWHASDGGKYQEIRIDFDDTLFQAAYRDAREKGWPFIIHIEFGSLDQGDRRSYLAKLSKFLRANADHPFVMIHMAQLEAAPVRRLLDAHPNLHFMTSHASPFYRGGGKPFIDMFDDESLKPEWRQLIADYPGRFVFALDNVFSKFWMPELYLAKMEMWWRALSELPDELAHAVAHGNAERLWKLAPKDSATEIHPPWIAKTKLGGVKGHSAGRMHR